MGWLSTQLQDAKGIYFRKYNQHIIIDNAKGEIVMRHIKKVF
jgi:hypothetical protein